MLAQESLILLKHIETSMEDDAINDDSRQLRILCFEEDQETVMSLLTMYTDQSDDDDEDFMFLLLLIILWKTYNVDLEDNFVFSRNRHIFHQSLNAFQRRIRDRRIPRMSLLNPSRSPWRQLYTSGSDQALITYTGLDHATFSFLLTLFAPLCNDYTPNPDPRKLRLIKQKGHRRMHRPSDILGLSLAWTRTKGSNMSLSIAFGMTASNVHRYLYFGRRILITVLKNQPDAAICIPPIAKIQEYVQAIHARHNYLPDVWCCLDGLQLQCDHSNDPRVQRVFYNGWKSAHFVKGVFVFVPDGRIVLAYYNVPGNVHDSQIAVHGNIYQKLERVYLECGARAVGDSAFCASRNPSIIQSSQNFNRAQPNFAHMTDQDIHQYMVNRQATSMRQASEWGMGGLQTSFPRLADRIRWEDRGERRLIIKCIIFLWNLRASRVGINQIRNTYMAHLNEDADDLLNLD